MTTSITSVSVCDSLESIPETYPYPDPEPSDEDELPVFTSRLCSAIVHCLQNTKFWLNRTLLKFISLMRFRPELIVLVNSVLVPLFISSLVVLKSADSKKLYAGYDEGPFFKHNPENPLPWNFHDIHDSSLDALDDVVASAKATVILSYAHWSVNSLDSRDAFTNLARHFSAHTSESGRDSLPRDGVHFVAIDCWLPNGKCRNVSKGLGSFPRILIVIPEVNVKVRYNGPVTFHALKQEIESLLQPYSVVRSVEQIRLTLVSSPSSLVAFDDGALSPHSDLSLALYKLRARLSVGTFPSSWSRPAMMVVTSKPLKSYLCNMDCGLSSNECSDFTQMKKRGVLIYKGQKIARVFLLNENPASVLQQLWETIQAIYAPEIDLASWNEVLKSERIRLPRSHLELVDTRIISSLTEVISKQFDFTFILHSRDEKFVLDFLALKRILGSCRKNYKKLYCVSLHPVMCNVLENSDCTFCQLCTKYDNLRTILPLFTNDMAPLNSEQTEKRDFLKFVLRRSVSLFCYDSLDSMADAEMFTLKDIEIQKVFSNWRSAVYTKDSVKAKVLSLSKCRHNTTLQFAYSTSSDIAPTHSETHFKDNASFLDIFELKNQQVFRVNVTSLDDVLDVIQDFASSTFDIGQSERLLNFEYPSHFLYRQGKNGSEVEGRTQEVRGQKAAPEFDMSFCKSEQVWQRNNSINCLVLHYTSWCGFCKTVLHVFHTVSHLMTSNFPNVTEFVQVNSAVDHVPWQHSVSKFPAIVFYPAAATAASNVDIHNSDLHSSRSRNNYTHVYPADVAITVPNLYGFVRLHSGVY